MLKRLSIRSKLLLMMLVVGLASIAIFGSVAFLGSRDALTDQIAERLTLQREGQLARITEYFADVDAQVRTMSEDRMIIDATRQFTVAFEQLDTIEPTAEQMAAIEADYLETLTAIAPGLDSQLDLYIPSSNAALNLQSLYRSGDGEFHDIVDAGDGSFYSRAHARFHPILDSYNHAIGWFDIFLVAGDDLNIVYTALKEIDVGTSLVSGPYANTGLAEAVKTALAAPDLRGSYLADFRFYRPSADVAAAFVASAIVDGGEIIGVLAFQLDVEVLNAVMTVGERWEDVGFGSTGETYLVGRDRAMRSQSRLLVQNPQKYRERLINVGSRPEDVDTILDFGSSILRQRADTEPVRRALAGETGVDVATSYHGGDVLAAYAPLPLAGLDWAIIAEIEATEVGEPITELQRVLLIATGAVVLGLTLLSVIFARRFVKPIESLNEWAHALADRETTDDIVLRSKDEYGELATSFNTVLHEFRRQTKTIEAQSATNERLLAGLMPPAVARRVQAGETEIADAFPQTTIGVLQLYGFVDFAARDDAEASVNLLAELYGALDEEAIDLGVEKIHTMGDRYIVACGMYKARVDQRRRVVDFAHAAREITQHFNAIHGTEFTLKAGVASGPIEAGVIGVERPVYNVWGLPLEDASGFADHAGDDDIITSAEVAASLSDQFDFRPHTLVEIGDRSVEAWSLTQRVAESAPTEQLV